MKNEPPVTLMWRILLKKNPGARRIPNTPDDPTEAESAGSGGQAGNHDE